MIIIFREKGIEVTTSRWWKCVCVCAHVVRFLKAPRVRLF